MKRLFFLVINFLAFNALAQHEPWCAGVVVKSNSEVVVGNILYHPGTDLVIIRNADTTRLMNPYQIKSFRFYDEDNNINRKFISLARENHETDLAIFEVVLMGEISIVRLANSISINSPPNEKEYDYFFLRNGRIGKLNNFRNLLYPEIRSLVENEERALKLNPNILSDAIRYIQLFNKVVFSDKLFSSR